MDPPLVVAVVLNTNRCAATLAYLESLAGLTYPRCQVVVLDNASTDGSVEAIGRAFPDVAVLELQENRGYAGNNNVGIEAAIARGAEWIFVVNEDVVVAPECLSELVRVGQSDATAGVLGPMVYHADEPVVIQSAGGRLDDRWAARHRGEHELDVGQYAGPCRVDWVSGCAILIRRAVIDEVGVLDDRFFYYWEEVDLCLRASTAGHSIVHVPSARVWHSGAQRTDSPAPSVAYYNTRNQFLLMAKHQAPLGVKLANWARVGWTVTSWALLPGRADRREHRRAMLRGAIDFTCDRYGRMPPPLVPKSRAAVG